MLRAELHKLRTSPLAHNAGWMLLGQGSNLVLQATYFVFLARLLGVREYGVFVGAFAFTGIAMPYSSLGSGLLFVRYVGIDHKQFAPYWGNILLSTLLAGSTLTIVFYFLGVVFLNPASASIVLPVGIANCIFVQLLGSMAFVFQTYELLKMAALLNMLTNAFRLLAVVILTIALHSGNAKQWALATLCCSGLAAAVGVAIVTTRYGRPKFVPQLLVSRAMEGLGFTLGWSAQSAYNDIDKTLLSHYGMNIQNGIYTMAYRIIDIATTPVVALDAAALPRYVRYSADDLRNVQSLAFRLARRASLIGAAISVTLFFAAPLIPHIVGGGFSGAVLALRWLCLLPAMRGIHYLTGCALTGAGFQRFRTSSQLCVAALNLGLNLWLIPRFGWIGAAWTSLASDGSLAVVNWIMVRRMTASRMRFVS